MVLPVPAWLLLPAEFPLPLLFCYSVSETHRHSVVSGKRTPAEFPFPLPFPLPLPLSSKLLPDPAVGLVTEPRVPVTGCNKPARSPA
jgi:hypothetical protein